MPLPANIPLPGGLALPAVGLGTFRARGQEASDAVAWALSAGYRHIDTASIYKASAGAPLSAVAHAGCSMWGAAHCNLQSPAPPCMQNEAEVGAAVRVSGIPREQVPAWRTCVGRPCFKRGARSAAAPAALAHAGCWIPCQTQCPLAPIARSCS